MHKLTRFIPKRGAVTRAVATTALALTTTALSVNVQAAQELPKVPTTRIIAIGHLTPTATPDAVGKVLPQEVRDTVELHLAGKIDQWFVRKDQNGVVFMLNNVDMNEAKAMLDRLPLGKAGLMEFELIPVGPLSPLGLLVGPTAKP